MADNPICVICGYEIDTNTQLHTGDQTAHGYCYDVNRNFLKGKDGAMHYRNAKTNKVVVPEIDGEGYLTGRYQTLSESAVEAKIKVHEIYLKEWREQNRS